MHYNNLIISGASGGLGACIARRSADFCSRLILLYNKSEQNISLLTDELKDKCDIVTVKCDLSDTTETSVTARKISELFDVDGLVNCAGMSLVKQIQDCTDEEITKLININLTSAIILSKAFISKMISAKLGNIVNVSSIWGELGASCEAVYSASKAGLIGFTEALARETGLSGIRVNAVCPGMIDTHMNDCFNFSDKSEIVTEIPLGRIADPYEIAGSVVFLLSEKSSYINGQKISPNGGMLI